MIQKVTKNNLILILFLIFSQLANAQKSIISFGLNVIHNNDWKNKPLRFFNPEIKYTKFFKKNTAVTLGINSFYGEADPKDFQNPGDVLQRLIFTTDITLKEIINNFSVNIGPSFRYRNEKIKASCTSCPPWEIIIERQKGHIDFGAIGVVNYRLFSKTKFFFEFSLAYRLYGKGVNQASLGLFYNRHL